MFKYIVYHPIMAYIFTIKFFSHNIQSIFACTSMVWKSRLVHFTEWENYKLKKIYAFAKQ